MKLSSRYGAAMIGIFLLLILFLILVRAVDEFDPMAAAIIWTIGGLAFAAVMISVALGGRKRKDAPVPAPTEESELDMDGS